MIGDVLVRVLAASLTVTELEWPSTGRAARAASAAQLGAQRFVDVELDEWTKDIGGHGGGGKRVLAGFPT